MAACHLKGYHRGDTIRLLFSITRSRQPLNVTGASFRFTARRWKSDNVFMFQKLDSSFQQINPAGGEVVVTIDPSDTLSLEDDTIVNWDTEMIESSGRVTTVAYGTMELLYDVTR